MRVAKFKCERCGQPRSDVAHRPHARCTNCLDPRQHHTYKPTAREIRTRAESRVQARVLRVLDGLARIQADKLRETADQLDLWWINRDGAGDGRAGIHPKHAANRMRVIADQISTNTSKSKPDSKHSKREERRNTQWQDSTVR